MTDHQIVYLVFGIVLLVALVVDLGLLSKKNTTILIYSKNNKTPSDTSTQTRTSTKFRVTVTVTCHRWEGEFRRCARCVPGMCEAEAAALAG